MGRSKRAEEDPEKDEEAIAEGGREKKKKSANKHVDVEEDAALTKKNKKAKRQKEAEEEAEVAPKPKKRGQVTPEEAVQPEPGEDAALTKKNKKAKRQKEAEEEDELAPEAAPADEERAAKKAKRKHLRDVEGVSPNESKSAVKPENSKPGDSGGADQGQAHAGQEPMTVCVAGIPFSCSAAVLKRDFEECGEVTDVDLLTDKITGRSRGAAFITFKTEAAVLEALKYDGEPYGGRSLKVYRAEAAAVQDAKFAGSNFEVFVKNLQPETTEESLRSRFEGCGFIRKLNLPTRSNGKCKGFAWLTFTSKEDMDKAIEFNGTDSGKDKLVVEAAGNHVPSGAGKGKGKGKVSTEREVFLSNLPYEAQEADLRKDFSECGEIERMHIPMKGEKCMGFAWITFTTQESVENALKYDGDVYGGRRLRIEMSGKHKSGTQAKGKGKDAQKGAES